MANIATWHTFSCDIYAVGFFIIVLIFPPNIYLNNVQIFSWRMNELKKKRQFSYNWNLPIVQLNRIENTELFIYTVVVFIVSFIL